MADRTKGGQCKAPSTQQLRSSRVPCPCVHLSALLPPPFLHLPSSAPQPVSPVISGSEGPTPSHFPSILQSSGLLQREMSWRPRPALPSSQPPPPPACPWPPGPGPRGPVSSKLDPSRSDPSGPSLAGGVRERSQAAQAGQGRDCRQWQ